MTQPVMTVEELGIWLAGLEVAFGAAMLVFGLRDRSRFRRTMAPLGAWFVFAGAFRLLGPRLPLTIVMPLTVVVTVALVAWFVRQYRASRAGR